MSGKQRRRYRTSGIGIHGWFTLAAACAVLVAGCAALPGYRFPAGLTPWLPGGAPTHQPATPPASAGTHAPPAAAFTATHRHSAGRYNVARGLQRWAGRRPAGNPDVTLIGPARRPLPAGLSLVPLGGARMERHTCARA
ncbi:MAG: hypothetical protein ACYDCJ_09530 [Gammaproteobacteria bacterium]